MASTADKKTTTVRLGEVTMQLLQKASYVLDRSQSQIIDEALREYFTKHHLDERYILSIRGSHMVLFRHERDQVYVVEVREKNGVAPEVVVEQYRTRLRAPVALVIQDSEGASP